MDAHLSRPPEPIPDLLAGLGLDRDMVGESCYPPGGVVERGWNLRRSLNPQVATTLALPLANCSDLMSGFFAIRRSALPDLGSLQPIGYKFGPELMVRAAAAKRSAHRVRRPHRLIEQDELAPKGQVPSSLVPSAFLPARRLGPPVLLRSDRSLGHGCRHEFLPLVSVDRIGPPRGTVSLFLTGCCVELDPESRHDLQGAAGSSPHAPVDKIRDKRSRWSCGQCRHLCGTDVMR